MNFWCTNNLPKIAAPKPILSNENIAQGNILNLLKNNNLKIWASLARVLLYTLPTMRRDKITKAHSGSTYSEAN